MTTGDDKTTETPAETISPEEQLRRVAEGLREVTQFRRHNGRGKAHSYVGKVDDIAFQGRHLADIVLQYLAGELKPLPTDGSTPF